MKVYKLLVKTNGEWKVTKWFKNKDVVEAAVSCHPEISRYEEVDFEDMIIEMFNEHLYMEYLNDK